MYGFKEITINLNKVSDIKEFSNIVMTFQEDIDVFSGRFILDAKSIMSLFSLDLSKNIKVNIHTNDINVYNDFKGKMEKFTVNE